VNTYTVNDGNGGNNYTVSTANNLTGVINKAALTITAATNTKTYDGTTSAAATPTVTGLQTGDTASGLSEVYADKNAGSGKTLSVNTYTVNDGNGGNNYTVTMVNDTTGVIIAAANVAAPLPGNPRIDDATLLRITRAGEEEKLKTDPKRGNLLLTVLPDFIRL
jgi:hypothetical protein